MNMHMVGEALLCKQCAGKKWDISEVSTVDGKNRAAQIYGRYNLKSDKLDSEEGIRGGKVETVDKNVWNGWSYPNVQVHDIISMELASTRKEELQPATSIGGSDRIGGKRTGK